MLVIKLQFAKIKVESREKRESREKFAHSSIPPTEQKILGSNPARV
jgi:hypothetical protein